MTFQQNTITFLNEVGLHIKENYKLKSEICNGYCDLWLKVGDDIEIRAIPHVDARRSEYFVKRYFDNKGYDLGKFTFEGVMCLIEGKVFDSGIIYSVNEDMWFDYPVGSHQSD